MSLRSEIRKTGARTYIPDTNVQIIIATSASPDYYLACLRYVDPLDAGNITQNIGILPVKASDAKSVRDVEKLAAAYMKARKEKATA